MNLSEHPEILLSPAADTKVNPSPEHEIFVILDTCRGLGIKKILLTRVRRSWKFPPRQIIETVLAEAESGAINY